MPKDFNPAGGIIFSELIQTQDPPFCMRLPKMPAIKPDVAAVTTGKRRYIRARQAAYGMLK